MAKISSNLKILEQCSVCPPPPSSSAPPKSASLLPLTFLDIPWLLFPPSKPLFFYHLPYSTSHITNTILPNLKQSLSVTLQYFYPFAGTLLLLPEPNKPKIAYESGKDSVPLTVVEFTNDKDCSFLHLSGNHQRNANEFHSLVPQLRTLSSSSSSSKFPLLAIQITIFPNHGICIGLAYHHVVADGRTFNNFMKMWASFSRAALFDDSSLSMAMRLPSYDRTVIVDANTRLEGIFLKEWWRQTCTPIIKNLKEGDAKVEVRATFVMSASDIETIKTWILGKCRRESKSLPVHLSPYVLACSFIWVCLVKAQSRQYQSNPTTSPKNSFSLSFGNNTEYYFGFNAGGLTRLDYPIPKSYLGNCVGFGQSMAIRDELVGDEGIIVAARAIGSTIKKLDKAILENAEEWMSAWEVSNNQVVVVGSPKLDLYNTDFGWGRAMKIEEIAIDVMGLGAAISLTESRDNKGGMEIGLVLPKSQMDDFTAFFNNGFKSILSCN